MGNTCATKTCCSGDTKTEEKKTQIETYTRIANNIKPNQNFVI